MTYPLLLPNKHCLQSNRDAQWHTMIAYGKANDLTHFHVTDFTSIVKTPFKQASKFCLCVHMTSGARCLHVHAPAFKHCYNILLPLFHITVTLHLISVYLLLCCTNKSTISMIPPKYQQHLVEFTVWLNNC